MAEQASMTGKPLIESDRVEGTTRLRSAGQQNWQHQKTDGRLEKSSFS
jgi:hypothetical protein